MELILSFLDDNGIKKDSYALAIEKTKAQQLPDNSNFKLNCGMKTLFMILIDTYRFNAENVKCIALKIAKSYGAIGRCEKDLLKQYLDYNDKEAFQKLYNAVNDFGMPQDALYKLISSYNSDFTQAATEAFVVNWNVAEEAKDEAKKFDYINGLYTRLISIFNFEKISLNYIYKYNEKFIKEELKEELQLKLKEFCDSTTEFPAEQARKQFCNYYESILHTDLVNDSNQDKLEAIMNRSFAKSTPFYPLEAETFGLVLMNINQSLYDSFSDFNGFMDSVLMLLKQAYRLLINHKSLVINIDNIYTNDNKNIKWMLYSYIGIYAEHFIPVNEKRRFYNPEELCYDKCEYLGIKLTDNEKKAIERYFSNNCSKDDLQQQFGEKIDVNEIVLDFENVWYGYTFSDCLAIISGEYKQNTEIEFIKNNNQIVLVFNKYRHDDRKIPCPDCAGLNISGNSFPEVGLRSWECKNTICPSRSKSNRGKRYSYKSNFMQNGFDDGIDIISKDLIKKWRRDICLIEERSEIFNMAVQYFSFTNDNVLVINSTVKNNNYFLNRHITNIELESFIGIEISIHEYNNYFHEGNYVKRYLNQIHYRTENVDKHASSRLLNSEHSIIAHGDSRKILSQITADTFTAAVTSPPYYNARLYSQWPNLYLYLSDMSEIIKQVYRTMKPGGIYLYNIGDICGNENTIVRSNMGNKRILLGAYTIHLFTSAGFELLDNILWDKGEPQSNRQKNDGKFTPFYQKPMNVYEHMFLFKKPGAPAIVNDKVNEIINFNWTSNIVPFSPVIKINSKGENTLGHTAPFPPSIPDFVATIFTKSYDDIILEPFAGSGTSIIASDKNNRRCFGIELCDDYIELIKSLCLENNVRLDEICRYELSKDAEGTAVRFAELKNTADGWFFKAVGEVSKDTIDSLKKKLG